MYLFHLKKLKYFLDTYFWSSLYYNWQGRVLRLVEGLVVVLGIEVSELGLAGKRVAY